MYDLNSNGLSSSLTRPATGDFWNTGRRNRGMKIVPVVTMKDVLGAIPPRATIEFIQTDTQGYDFAIIKSAVHDLKKRGVQYLKTEVWTDNVITYEGVDNDLCLHWMPMMEGNGYTFVGMINSNSHGHGGAFMTPGDVRREVCAKQSNGTSLTGLNEADALWKLSTLAQDDIPVDIFIYPTLRAGQPPMFSSDEYAQCQQSNK